MPEPPSAAPLALDVAEGRILGHGPRYTPAQLWAESGVSEEIARQLWLAMGFPSVPEDEAVLTRRDLDALRHAGELLATGAFEPPQLVAQTRVMSQAMSTIATAHVETLGVDRAGGTAGFLGGLADADDGDVLAVLDELLSYLYRRHLLAALERVTLAGDATSASLPVTVVGFADLTDFSATAARATEEELTVLVDDFATIAANLVAAAGGRVVKLIGDEVMFSVDQPGAAAGLALSIVETAGRPDLPPVHVGLAMGPVLSHHGDLFGSTVNLASRLSDVARPGSILANAALVDALGDAEGVEAKRVHLRSLKGIGHVPAFSLRRSRTR